MVRQRAWPLMQVHVGHVGNVITVLFQPANHVVFETTVIDGVVATLWAGLNICQILAGTHSRCLSGALTRVIESQYVWPVQRTLPAAPPSRMVVTAFSGGSPRPEFVTLNGCYVGSEYPVQGAASTATAENDPT